MNKIWIRIIIGISAVAICSLMPALLLYFLGYEKALEWNNSAIQTKCLVLENYVQDNTCSYSCNCYQTCSGSTNSRSCHQHCSTCYKICYDGYVTVSYNDTFDNNYKIDLRVYNSYSSSSSLKTKLNKKYPIGSNRDCYYQRENPRDVKLNSKKNPGIFLGFFITFLVIGFIGLIVWIIIEMFYCSRN